MIIDYTKTIGVINHFQSSFEPLNYRKTSLSVAHDPRSPGTGHSLTKSPRIFRRLSKVVSGVMAELNAKVSTSWFGQIGPFEASTRKATIPLISPGIQICPAFSFYMFLPQIAGE